MILSILFIIHKLSYFPIFLEVGKSTQSQINSVIDASLILNVKNKREVEMVGSAVAVTNKRALTALHGIIKVKTKVTLRTRRGFLLRGVIEFVKFSRSILQ